MSKSLCITFLESVEPASFLTLQIIMRFEFYYMIFYSVFMILLYCYKKFGGLKYPPTAWELEISSSIIFSVMQFSKLDLGFRANRNEHFLAMCCFTFFTAV